MEQDSIQEWIDYHRSLGVEHFFIYGNDDDPRVLIEKLAPYIVSRLVTFTHCPEPGEQVKMYLHFLNWHASRCDWVCFLDQDEYLRLQGFHDNIRALTDQLGSSAESIQLNWLNYGTSGNRERPPGSVLSQYVRRAARLDRHAKHITRARRLLAPGTLSGVFWHALPVTHVQSVSPLGDPHSFWHFLAGTADKDAYLDYLARRNEALIRSACIAHFHLKSEADLLWRVRRGTSGQFNGQIVYQQIADDPALKQPFIDASNAVEDRYLAAYWNDYLDSLVRGAPRWG